jgi:hypothetical protein
MSLLRWNNLLPFTDVAPRNSNNIILRALPLDTTSRSCKIISVVHSPQTSPISKAQLATIREEFTNLPSSLYLSASYAVFL